MKYLIGIDEVGRGPLAGPVTICACSVPSSFDHSHLEGIRDSKKLSPQKRQEWFEKISRLRSERKLSFAVASVSAGEIDTMGISHALKKAIRLVLSELGASPLETEIRLDGSLSAPREFVIQKTIIRGDEKEPVIAAASIVAKVTRDRYMTEISAAYSVYGFDEHKGYGTKRHIDAIRKHGVSPLHRRTFLTRLSPLQTA